MSIAAIVLAAGASKRLGEPKQLIRLNKETLLERTVCVARDSGCFPVVVVLGASAALIQATCNLQEATIAINDDWASGMGSSIGVGVAALPDVDACVVMTCDMPAVSTSHLRALMSASPGEIVASSYAGRCGVPAYFPSAAFADLKMLQGDTGARSLLQGVQSIELAGGELDVDTAEDLERLRRISS